METLGVIKPDMRIERQETLSPFGLLTQLFTEELLRRNAQAMGSYRPMQLAYLEEGEPEETGASPEIHFDLDVDLIVNKLLKKEKDSKERSEKKTPSQRILERVILREKEIRTAYPETRRVVVESAGRRMTANLPLTRQTQAKAAEQRGETIRESAGPARQAGEGRSTQYGEILRPSAALAGFSPAARSGGREKTGTLPVRTLTLASQAMSVPAAGGWTPRQQEVHPGYPTRQAEAQPSGVSAGSILLPDVMRRRREAALERQNTPGLYPEGPENLDSLEDALTWVMEGTEQTPEARRVLREVHRAVLETVRRNEAGKRSYPVPERAEAEAPEGAAEPLPRWETMRQEAAASRQAPAEEKLGPGTPASTRDAIPTREPSGQNVYSPEPLAPEETEGDRSGAAALPSEEKEPRPEEAALYFREAAEETTPEGSTARHVREGRAPGESGVLSARPEMRRIPAPMFSADGNAGNTEVSPAEVMQEVPDAVTPRKAAAPAAEQAEAAQAAALFYREEGETPASPSPERVERTGSAPVPAPGGPAVETASPRTPVSGDGPSVLLRERREQTAEEDAFPASDTDRPGAEPPAAALPGIRQMELAARTPTSAVPAQAAIPAALPAEGEAQAAKGAELIFRNDGDINEPHAPTGAAGKETHPEKPDRGERAVRETPGEDRQTPETPRTSHLMQTPRTPERAPRPAHRAETALPAVQPGEEAPTAELPALVYGESTPEQASPTAEDKRDMTGAPDRAAETRQTQPMRSPAAPEEGRAGQRTETLETVPAEAGRGEAPALSALPGEPASQAAAPAELVYRAEAAASQLGQSEAAPPQRAHPAEPPTAQPSAPRRQETRTAQNIPDSPRAETPLPRPHPERRERSAEPSAEESSIITDHPAETRRSAPSPERPAEGKEPETALSKETLPAAILAEGAAPQFPSAPLAYREEETPQAALPAALPAEAGAETNTPVPLAYREGENPQTALPAALPEEAGAETNTPAELAYREEETPQTALPAALPAEAEVETNTPAELVYRAEENAAPAQSPAAQGNTRQRPGDGRGPAPQAASPRSTGEAAAQPAAKAAPESARTGTSAPTAPQEREAKSGAPSTKDTASGSLRPMAETPRSAAFPQPGPAGQAAAPETAREETFPPEAPLVPGIPVETEAAFPESAALVYRKEGEEPSPPAQRPGEMSQNLRDSGRLIPPVPEQHTDEKTKAAPAAAMPLRTLTGERQAPAALDLRREGERAAPPPVGAVARDIRLTAERGRRPLPGAARISGQTANLPGVSRNGANPGAFPIPAAPEEGAIPAPAPVQEAEMLPELSELVYAATARSGDYGEGETPARPTRKAQEDKNDSLPVWAKELLEQAGVTDTAQQAAAFRGKLDGASGSRQISWNAPQAAAPSRSREITQPAELSFKERSQREETASQPRITEAELQKTADRVYRILEERLRRELRRSGR